MRCWFSDLCSCEGIVDAYSAILYSMFDYYVDHDYKEYKDLIEFLEFFDPKAQDVLQKVLPILATRAAIAECKANSTTTTRRTTSTTTTTFTTTSDTSDSCSKFRPFAWLVPGCKDSLWSIFYLPKTEAKNTASSADAKQFPAASNDNTAFINKTHSLVPMLSGKFSAYSLRVVNPFISFVRRPILNPSSFLHPVLA